MTLIINSSAPLWGRGGLAQSPTDIGLDSSDVPIGGLSQGWVLTAAVNQFGGLDNGTTGLQLPLPLDFANQNPGPSEVFVTVLEMATLRNKLRIYSIMRQSLEYRARATQHCPRPQLIVDSPAQSTAPPTAVCQRTVSNGSPGRTGFR